MFCWAYKFFFSIVFLSLSTSISLRSWSISMDATFNSSLSCKIISVLLLSVYLYFWVSVSCTSKCHRNVWLSCSSFSVFNFLPPTWQLDHVVVHALLSLEIDWVLLPCVLFSFWVIRFILFFALIAELDCASLRRIWSLIDCLRISLIVIIGSLFRL